MLQVVTHSYLMFIVIVMLQLKMFQYHKPTCYNSTRSYVTINKFYNMYHKFLYLICHYISTTKRTTLCYNIYHKFLYLICHYISTTKRKKIIGMLMSFHQLLSYYTWFGDSIGSSNDVTRLGYLLRRRMGSSIVCVPTILAV